LGATGIGFHLAAHATPQIRLPGDVQRRTEQIADTGYRHTLPAGRLKAVDAAGDPGRRQISRARRLHQMLGLPVLSFGRDQRLVAAGNLLLQGV